MLLALDGNSAAVNLVQEGKNGKFKCDMYVDGRSRALKAKARTLQGYVTVFTAKDDPAEQILNAHDLR